jgi:hypothetical protein
MYSTFSPYKYCPSIKKWTLNMLFMMACLSPGFIPAQQTVDIDPAYRSPDKNLAPVRFEGEILFYVRGVSSLPADQRARTINSRIRKAAAHTRIPPDSIRIITETERIAIYAGNDFIMNVYPIDAEAEGVSPFR